MEAVRNWALLIAGFAVLASCMESVMPSGEMRKYLRLAMALMMTLAMVMPIAELISDRPFARIPEIREQAYRQHSEMEERQQKDVLGLYQKNLDRKMQAALTEKLPDRDISVHCEIQNENPEKFGTVDMVTVLLSSGANMDTDIEDCLTAQFGIGAEKIRIRYLKE